VIRSGGQPTGATFYSARCGDLPASVPKTNHKDNAYGLQGLKHAADENTGECCHVFSVRCSLFVVRCLLFVVCCLLFAVY